MSHKIDNARERLLAEGKSMLVEYGFDQWNIRKLVKNCDIAIGTFYNNFSSKEELTVEILRADWERILYCIDEAAAMQEPFKKKLERIYSSVYKFFHNYKNVFVEMLIKSIPAKNDNAETKMTFCNKLSALLTAEIAKGTIQTRLEPEKLSYIILQNFIYMSKEDYVTFDEFYQLLEGKGI